MPVSTQREINLRITYDCLAFCIVSFFVLGRYYIVHIYSRKKSPHTHRVSTSTTCVDLLIASAVVFCFIVAALDIRSRVWMMYKGPKENLHQVLGVPKWHAQSMLLNYVFCDFAYLIVLWSIKGCFLGIYLGVCNKLSKRLRYHVYFTASVTFLAFVVLITTTGLWCRPISRSWSLGSDFCATAQTLDYTRAVFGVHLSTDLLILSISILTLRSITLGRRERSALIFVIALGSTTMVAASVRYYFCDRLKNAASDSTKNWLFPTGVYYATTFEAVAGVVTACLPAYKVLVRGWLEGKEERDWAKKGARASISPASSADMTGPLSPRPFGESESERMGGRLERFEQSAREVNHELMTHGTVRSVQRHVPLPVRINLVLPEPPKGGRIGESAS